MSVNQNVPTLRRVRHQQRLPAESRTTRTTASIPPSASSNYHGLHVSFVQRPATWGSYRVTYTLSKSMNNVGEVFFSSPIDPFDISKDWGRSDDDQRHRLVLNGSVNSSMEPATTAWQRISHGFQVSGMLQYYSALPFNITSGVHDRFRARRAGRSSNGDVHRPQRRRRQRLLQPEPAAEPGVPDRRPRAGWKGSSRRSTSRIARTT